MLTEWLGPLMFLGALLLLAIWAFCRAYYFLFYVIQHYLDPRYRYAGLWHFLRTRILRQENPDR